MRSHSALYVDAGYLLSSAATRVTGSSLRRGIEVDYEALIAALTKVVEGNSGLPLLRVYWYDAARDGKATSVQEGISLLPNVKLRLGRIGVDGEQKGVDLRIGLDLVGHSRGGRVDVMYLLSVDDDLTEAVEEAQAQGVQVTVLAVPTGAQLPHGVSRHLLYAADGLTLLDADILDRTIAPSTPVSVTSHSDTAASDEMTPSLPPTIQSPPLRPSPAAVAKISSILTARPFSHAEAGPVGSRAQEVSMRDPEELSEMITTVAQKTFEAWVTTATLDQQEELRAGRPSIPRDLDRALLVDLSGSLGEFALSDAMRFALRARFWESVDSGRGS